MLRPIAAGALDLLDCLAAYTAPGVWVSLEAVSRSTAGYSLRTHRRGIAVLSSYGLVQTRGPLHARELRATDLGRALIDAHHTAEE
jgi:hypothetical protein